MLSEKHHIRDSSICTVSNMPPFHIGKKFSMPPNSHKPTEYSATQRKKSFSRCSQTIIAAQAGNGKIPSCDICVACLYGKTKAAYRLE
jgi:hypothetical protein